MKQIFERAQLFSAKRDPKTKLKENENENAAATETKLIKLDDQGTSQNPDVLERNRIELLSLLKQLKLRYFTPIEIAKILGFPVEAEAISKKTETEVKFEFPPEFGANSVQAYRVLGNSVSVTTVSFLTTLLFQQSL